MILSQKIEIYYKNSIENIKKCENKLEKAKMIKALKCDLSGKGITIIASKLNMAFKTIKNYYLTDFNNAQTKKENRGRKSVEEIYPNLINQIKEIVGNENALFYSINRIGGSHPQEMPVYTSDTFGLRQVITLSK